MYLATVVCNLLTELNLHFTTKDLYMLNHLLEKISSVAHAIVEMYVIDATFIFLY